MPMYLRRAAAIQQDKNNRCAKSSVAISTHHRAEINIKRIQSPMRRGTDVYARRELSAVRK